MAMDDYLLQDITQLENQPTRDKKLTEVMEGLSVTGINNNNRNNDLSKITERTDDELGDMTHYLSQYIFVIKYKPGKDNVEADCLSRNPVFECNENEEDKLQTYKFHAKIDDQIDKANVAMTQGLIGKLMSVLESTLTKLARYDEGSLIGSILSFTNVSSSGKDLGQGYVNFFRNNMDQVRGKIGDDLWTLNFFEQWYTQQINMLCNWLSERLDHALHYAQVTSISHITKKIYSDFELQGVLEDKLNSKAYQTVAQRVATEEATCALSMPDVAECEDNMDTIQGEGGVEDVTGDEVAGSSSTGGISRGLPKPKIAAAQAAAVTNVVAGRVGNLLGKAIDSTCYIAPLCKIIARREIGEWYVTRAFTHYRTNVHARTKLFTQQLILGSRSCVLRKN
ncbi:calcium-dependent secretion activator-like [Anastrepha obliqua]|uniref:calcium-dependent secretion activator-like n=1 Tax=Anastrepha obliqua TaxID=95512 RepID=UPI00240A9477|nr:calcium-dependent secretion activator-like [Anastrepha obliqua]